jgi:hypothetical protein
VYGVKNVHFLIIVIHASYPGNAPSQVVGIETRVSNGAYLLSKKFPSFGIYPFKDALPSLWGAQNSGSQVIRSC